MVARTYNVIFDRKLHMRAFWTTALLFSMAAINAATPLPEEEIKKLLPGHMVASVDSQGRSIEKVFHSDGLLKGRRDSKRQKEDVGEWWVPGDGKVCWKWRAWGKGKEKCRKIERDGDGVFLVNSEGKRWAVSK